MLRSELRAVLESVGVRPSKGRGQNFLVDDNVAAALVAAVRLGQNDRVLEVGPGLGALTAVILRFQPGSFWLLEREPAFVKFLLKRFPALNSQNIIEGDVRELVLGEIAATGDTPWVVVCNVPYSISTDFLLWLIRERQHINRAALLFQREFAERVAAEPGCRAYGSLSVMADNYFEREIGLVVEPSAFHPRPRVESRQVVLRVRQQPLASAIEPEWFETVVRGAFRLKRKTLLNSLMSAELVSSREEGERAVDAVLTSIVEPVTGGTGKLVSGHKVRAEQLSTADFVRLAQVLKKD